MTHPFIAALQSSAIFARLAWSRKGGTARKCAHNHSQNSDIKAVSTIGLYAFPLYDEAEDQSKL